MNISRRQLCSKYTVMIDTWWKYWIWIWIVFEGSIIVEFDFGVDKPVSHQIMSNLVKISILLHNKISQTNTQKQSKTLNSVVYSYVYFINIFT